MNEYKTLLSRFSDTTTKGRNQLLTFNSDPWLLALLMSLSAALNVLTHQGTIFSTHLKILALIKDINDRAIQIKRPHGPFVQLHITR
jgi:hypothetical protein